MNLLSSLLRLRPMWVSSVSILASLLLYFVVWPAWVPSDRDRRGVWLLVGGFVLWTLIEWALLALRHYREQQTRPGLLRQLFRGALRHLIREAQGEGWMRADALIARPWFVVMGSGEAGIARLLERAGFRRIVSCALPGEAPVCVFWLSQDAVHGSVVVEVSGSALTDTEGGEQLHRWLRKLRAAPDAVILQVGLQEIWGATEEQARGAAVQLSPALHTLLRQYKNELSVHVICSQIARLDGLSHYFRSAERRPFGFRLDRPLHSDFQASLVQERTEAILKALWQQTNSALLDGSFEPPTVEVMLDFPRELRRMSVHLGAFITKLCEGFSADTRARLYEVFFANSDSAPPFEAARHRRLPLSRAAVPLAGSEPAASYFLPGLFVRMAGLSRLDAPRAASRQVVALWALTALSVLLMTLLSTFYSHRHRGQEAVRRQVVAVLRGLEQLNRLKPVPPDEKSQELQKALGDFLQQDGDVSRTAQRFADLQKGILVGSPAQPVAEEIYRRTQEYLQCQAANHLVSPLLVYEKKDLLVAASQRGGSSAQPLYERLLRLQDFTDPKRRAVKTMALSPLSTTEWFDALYAIALLQRRSCVPGKEDSKWLSGYLRSLWPLSSDREDSLSRRVEERLNHLLGPYLAEVDASLRRDARSAWEPKICSQLGKSIEQQPVEQARQLLERGSGLFASQSGVDIPAALELELRIKSSAKDSKDGPLKAFKGTGFGYLHPREDVSGEATRLGCQRIMGSQTDQIRWLRCILPSEGAASWQSGGVSGKRLAEQYRLRLEHVWASWLGRIGRRPLPQPASLENELADLGSAVGSVLADLPSLFRSLGVGDGSKLEGSEACRDSVRSFAPFRWAVDADDEQGSPKPSSLTTAWRDYQTELTTLRDALVTLSRPPKTPEEGMALVLSALSGLQRVEQKRLEWLSALRSSLQGTATPGSGLQDAIEKKASLVEALRDLEEKILQALAKKGRRLVACQWDSLRRLFGDAVAAPSAQQAQPGLEEQRGKVRNLLAGFRDQTLARLFTLPSCEARSLRLQESTPTDNSRVVSEAFCRRVKDLIDQTGVAAAPAAPDRPSAAPSVVPTPDSQCMQQAAVLRTYLDVPELQARFVCHVSARLCERLGATAASRVQLQVEWVGQGLSEVVPLGSLRDVLARPPVHRVPGQRPTHMEPDPWRQQEVRYAVEVDAPSLCRGRKFRLYFDEAVAGRGAGKPAWIDPTQLDAAAALIQDTCR